MGFHFDDWHLIQVLSIFKYHLVTKSSKGFFIGNQLPGEIKAYLETNFGLNVINFGSGDEDSGSYAELARFTKELISQFEIPLWFSEAISEIGGNIDQGIIASSSLSDIFPGFDVTTRVRLALRLEKKLRVTFPLDKIVDPDLTVLDLLVISKELQNQ